MTIANVYLDTETVPNETFMMEEVAEKCLPPATYSKPESIEAWFRDKRPSAVIAAQHALGLQMPYQRIVCISWALGDETPITHYGDDEREVLRRFFAHLSDKIAGHHPPISVRYVGHNIAGFDLPAIWWACIRNDVTYHHLPNPRTVKPWDTMKITDTMYQLSGGNPKGYSLANMCKLFGIKSMLPDVDGSKVWDMWKAGKQPEVADYCADDVRLVRHLYKRIGEYLP